MKKARTDLIRGAAARGTEIFGSKASFKKRKQRKI